MRSGRPALALLVAVLVAPASASADATVACSGLQAALDDPANAVVTLTPAEGLCSGRFTLPDRPLTLRGQPGRAGFEADGPGRSLSGSGLGADQTFDALVFAGAGGGDHGGGLRWLGSGADVTVVGSRFEGVSADDESGGGLRIDDPTGAITLDAVVFAGNTTELLGGGARLNGGAVAVRRSTFNSNRSGLDGGGLALTIGPRAPGALATGSVTGTSFVFNEGGRDVCFPSGGGGLWAGDAASARDDDASVTTGGCAGDRLRPRAAARRAAADPSRGRLEVGDDLHLANTVGVLGRPAMAPNPLPHFGGGAQFSGLDVVASTTDAYFGNRVLGGDGGTSGGAFAVQDGSYTGVNTVVVGNSARTRPTQPGPRPAGGGIHLACGGCSSRLDLTHATITGNRVLAEGSMTGGGVAAGVQATALDTVAIDRSIVYANAVGFDPGAEQIDGAALEAVTNSDTPDTPSGNGNLAAPPVFSWLGPPYQAASSPTVDAVVGAASGRVVPDDFRHEPRPAGARADMGADELQPGPVVRPPAGPVPAPRPTPAPDGSGAGENERAKRPCRSKRRFRVLLRKRRGVTWVAARFRLAGRTLETRRFHGRLGAVVDLRGRGGRRVVLSIRAVTKRGRVVRSRRVYRPCAPERPRLVAR